MNEDPLNPNSQDSQRRLLLALALAMVLTTVYTYFFAPRPPPPPEAQAPTADAGVTTAEATPPVPPPGTPTATPPGTPTAEAAPPPPPVRTLQLQRPEVHYSFSTAGGGLTSAVLQGAKMREQPERSIAEGYKQLFGSDLPPPPQMDVARPVEGQPLPLAISVEGPQPLPGTLPYAVEERQGGVTFTGRHGPWEVTRSLQWPQEGFGLAYTVQLRNTSNAPLKGDLVLHYSRAIDPNLEQAPSLLGGVGNLSLATCYVGDEALNLGPEDKPLEAEKLQGPISYFGINQQYFLSALYPVEGPLTGRCNLLATPTGRVAQLAIPVEVAPGATYTLRLGGYLGPKDPDLLAAAPGPAVREATGLTAASFDPPLEETIDYGIWAAIARVLIAIMKFFHGLAGNWGVAIILLTVLVKLLLLPLTYQSMVSMEGLKKLQPRMEEIRKKYAEDRERQNLEMMKLYQEAKVNPLGGCLPLLLQMPVWIALFTALRHSYDLYSEPFFGPVWQDLTYKDPTYLLPLALGVTMIITQKLQPQMGDPMQAKIMTWVLPVVFTATLLNYPSGLALYIFTNNVLSIGQQYGLRKWLERRGGGGGTVAPAATASAGGKRK